MVVVNWQYEGEWACVVFRTGDRFAPGFSPSLALLQLGQAPAPSRQWPGWSGFKEVDGWMKRISIVWTVKQVAFSGWTFFCEFCLKYDVVSSDNKWWKENIFKSYTTVKINLLRVAKRNTTTICKVFVILSSTHLSCCYKEHLSLRVCVSCVCLTSVFYLNCF